ncbi:uncharacterized protein LOC126654617 isoform X1 [Mercurialis annua]|uniref:uncharacterized protein LOC126654617 isoform X1 n=1 Tax=Mercurialis annua TaxID=3986 RepID=UPI00215EDBE3|nr:uncharacterized protein LOC126654617 isoform X1 [Mercurialis annua]
MDVRRQNHKAMENKYWLQQQAEIGMLQDDLRPQARVTRRVNAHYVAATVPEMQQENAASSVHQILHSKEKERVLCDKHQRRTSFNVDKYNSNSIFPRLAKHDCDASAVYASFSKDGSWTEDFLGSRGKHGGGSIGRRMNTEGCFTSASCFNAQTSNKREYGKCYSDKYYIMTDYENDELMGSRVKHHRGSALSRLGNKDPSISHSFPEAKRESAFSRLGNNNSSISRSVLEAGKGSALSRLGNNHYSVSTLFSEAKRESALSRYDDKDPSMSLLCPETKRMQVRANAVDAWRLGVISSAGYL